MKTREQQLAEILAGILEDHFANLTPEEREVYEAKFDKAIAKLDSTSSKHF